MNVVPFQEMPQLGDIPEQMHWLANRLKRGEFNPDCVVCIVVSKTGDLELFQWGAETESKYRLSGILQAAALIPIR